MVRLSDLIKARGGHVETKSTTSVQPSAAPVASPDEPVVDVMAEQLVKLRKNVEQTLHETAALSAPDSHPESVLCRRAERCVAALAEALLNDAPLSLGEASQVAHDIVASLVQDKTLVTRVLAPAQESSLIGNMVHTSIVATEIGLAIGYREDELAQLALAGLVHDIGMFRLPMPLVLRTGRWSRKQISIMQKHTQYGADAVKRVEKYAWLSDLIIQEHERINGSGYPSGLKGTQIHEPAQVIGLADRFDALLRSRSWRKGMLPYEAVRVVLSTEREHFSTRVLKGFVRSITLYPPGTWVKLSTGSVGMVTSINAQHPLRPVVSVGKRGRRGDLQGNEDVVDLSLAPSLCINQAITPVQAYSTTTH